MEVDFAQEPSLVSWNLIDRIDRLLNQPDLLERQTLQKDKKMQAKRGFTLVEILIVVVILGILAAIVIPQFTQASTEAKLNSLTSDLQTLRSQIELYKVQHNDIAPTLANFTTQMMYCTNSAGTADNPATKTRTATANLGPYLERIPGNPFSTVAVADDVVVWGSAVGTGGWEYNETTGEIRANDAAAHQSL
jgi:general secretion pathway protein G